MKSARLLLLAPILVALGTAVAPAASVSEDNPYKDIILGREPLLPYDESKDKPWQEQDIAAPEVYDNADLEEVAVTQIQKGFSVLVDKQLTIGEDGVIRYWLVLKSKQGAVNAMYEGLRCDTAEYKTYAFMVDRKTVEPMKHARWQKLRRALGNNFRWELMNDYFCYYGHPKPVDQIVRNLKAGPAVGPTDDIDPHY